VSAYIASDLRRRIRDHFDHCCAYCHTAERLTVVTFEIEHIWPMSAGGQSVFENLCLACPICNRHKADRTVAIDFTSGDEVELFHPQRDRWTDHFDWNEDFSEIVGRTARGRATIAALQMNRPQLIRIRRIWVAIAEHPPTTDQ